MIASEAMATIRLSDAGDGWGMTPQGATTKQKSEPGKAPLSAAQSGDLFASRAGAGASMKIADADPLSNHRRYHESIDNLTPRGEPIS